MESTKHQKFGSIMFSSSPLGSITFQQKPLLFLLLSTAHQIFSSQVLPALKSSLFHWLYLLISQFLIWYIWPLFLISPFLLSCSLAAPPFPGAGLPQQKLLLWCKTLPFRSSALAAGICTLSILTCNKLAFQLLPITVPVPGWFFVLKAILFLG